ncbi:MAG TPA: TonB-dependent receptor, partial [Sphingomicrobium sp.]
MKGSFVVRSGVSVIAISVALGTASLAGAQSVSPTDAPTDATAPPAQDVPPDEAQEVANSDIVVTGSRLGASGFTAPSPVTVLSAETLQQRAPAAIAETLYELPKLNNAGPTQANRGSTSVGFNVLDLRGLGGVRTLVLVDQRRYTPSNTTTVFDTNLIPTQLVDRIDIVTGGASAAYGSDAVSGVVNFILKDKLEGIQATIQKGISQEGDNSESVINFGAGHQFGRIHAMIGIDYNKNEGVGYPGIGFYARDWGRNEYGRLSLPATRAAGLPANILAANVQYANKTAGGIVTSGPLRGTAFGPGGVPFQFQYGSIVGTDQMIGTSHFFYTVTGRQPLRTPLERYVGLGRVSFDATDNLEFYAEGNYGFSEGTANTAQATIDNVVILRNNPYLPAATAAAMDAARVDRITIGRLNEEPGPYMTHNTNELLQGTAGFKADLGTFRFDGYYSQGRNKYHLDVANVTDIPNFRAANYAVRDGGGNIVCGPVATNPNLTAGQRPLVEAGCVPFNPFGINSPSAAANQYTTNYMFNDVTAKQSVAALNLAGTVFEGWAGPITAAIGGEWRRNTAVGTADARSAVGANFYGNYKPIDGRITVKEAYGEVGIPLLKDVTLIQALDFNGAVRVTDYSTSGTVTTWKVGLTYEPTDFLRVRGTRSHDIRAPNISELFAQGVGGVFTGNNPGTGAAGQAQTVTGGNRNLTPEIAETVTAGVVVTPGFLPGFRASVDYYTIKIRDVISAPSAVDILAQCYISNIPAACAAVVVDTSTVLGFSAINLVPLNLNRLTAEGIDLEVAYNPPEQTFGIPGQFSLRALGSYIRQLKITDATGRVFEQAGGGIPVAGLGGQPEWRWTFNVGYSLDKFFTAVQVRTFSGFKYGVNFVGPEDAGYSPTLSNSISKNRYPAAAYVNLALGINILENGPTKAQIYFNVDNLLDKDPPFAWIQDVAT